MPGADNVNLNDFELFVAISRAGSLTAAARAVHLTQPAVSKRLQELESQAGAPLFDRLPRGVRLTEAGRTLLPHAERILALTETAESELQALSGLQRGRLAIGASTTIGSYLVPGLFGRFRRRHPDVALTLEIANTAQIQSAVLDDRLDCGMTEGFVSSDALEVEVFAEDDMLAIVAPGDPLLARDDLRTQDLAALPMLMREPGSGSRDVVEAALAKGGLQIEPTMSLGSTEALKNAVAAGLGVAIVSRLTVELELSTGRLMPLPIADLDIHRTLHLLRLKGKQPSPAMQAFLDLMHERHQQDPGYVI